MVNFKKNLLLQIEPPLINYQINFLKSFLLHNLIFHYFIIPKNSIPTKKNQLEKSLRQWILFQNPPNILNKQYIYSLSHEKGFQYSSLRIIVLFSLFLHITCFQDGCLVSLPTKTASIGSVTVIFIIHKYTNSYLCRLITRPFCHKKVLHLNFILFWLVFKTWIFLL